MNKSLKVIENPGFFEFAIVLIPYRPMKNLLFAWKSHVSLEI